MLGKQKFWNTIYYSLEVPFNVNVHSNFLIGWRAFPPLNVHSDTLTPEPYSDLLNPNTSFVLLKRKTCIKEINVERRSNEQSRKPLTPNCTSAPFSQYKSWCEWGVKTLVVTGWVSNSRDGSQITGFTQHHQYIPVCKEWLKTALMWLQYASSCSLCFLD